MAMIQSTKPSLKFAARKLAYPLGYVGPPITSNPTKFREAAAAQYMLMLS